MKTKFQSVYISDIHLGCSASHTDLLLKFLNSIETPIIFLVGDIIDLWALKNNWFWPTNHNEVIKKFLSLADKGTKIIYILGNHDELLGFLKGYSFGNIEIHESYVYESKNKGKILLIHGDAFDNIVKYHKVIEHLGNWAYDQLITINKWFNKIRKIFGFSYWSLAGFLKRQSKAAGNFIENFEKAITNEAKQNGYQGVICGHIHKPDIKKVNNVTYMNVGDGVDSCMALVENLNGDYEHFEWNKI